MVHPPEQSAGKPNPAATELAAAQNAIRVALEEDLQAAGDVTSQLLIPVHWQGSVAISVRKPGTLAGLAFARLVFEELKARVRIDELVSDGDQVSAGTRIANVTGSIRDLLTAERTVLNLLTMLSGTATLTRKFVDQVTGTKAIILDTRKTFPGLRPLQKYAVRCGGGTNHRLGLYDGILIKDNHLAAWTQQGGSSLSEVLQDVRRRAPSGFPVEVEVDTLEQLLAAFPGSPDIILCDNMTPQMLLQAVALRNSHAPHVQLEASGGVDLSSVHSIAQTGIDRISIGALTHSAPALDIGFDWSFQGLAQP